MGTLVCTVRCPVVCTGLKWVSKKMNLYMTRQKQEVTSASQSQTNKNVFSSCLNCPKSISGNCRVLGRQYAINYRLLIFSVYCEPLHLYYCIYYVYSFNTNIYCMLYVSVCCLYSLSLSVTLPFQWINVFIISQLQLQSQWEICIALLTLPDSSAEQQ